MTGDRSAAADTLRDELAVHLVQERGRRLGELTTDYVARLDAQADIDALLPVVLRYADAQVAAALAAVRELHYAYRPGYTDDCDICPECTKQGYDVPWPCPTALALGEQS